MLDTITDSLFDRPTNKSAGTLKSSTGKSRPLVSIEALNADVLLPINRRDMLSSLCKWSVENHIGTLTANTITAGPPGPRRREAKDGQVPRIVFCLIPQATAASILNKPANNCRLP